MIYTINNCIRAFGYTNFDNLIADMGSVDNLKAYVIANGYADIAVGEDTELLLVDENGKEIHTGCYGAKLGPTYEDPHTMDYTPYQFYGAYVNEYNKLRYSGGEYTMYEYSEPSTKYCYWAAAKIKDDNDYTSGYELYNLNEITDKTTEFVLLRIFYINEDDDFKTAHKNIQIYARNEEYYVNNFFDLDESKSLKPFHFKKFGQYFYYEFGGNNVTLVENSRWGSHMIDHYITFEFFNDFSELYNIYNAYRFINRSITTTWEGKKEYCIPKAELTLIARKPSTVKLIRNSNDTEKTIMYRINWNTDWAIWDGSELSLNNGDTLVLKSEDDKTFRNTEYNYTHFEMTGSIDMDGNIMSLMNYSLNLRNTTQLFRGLFNGCKALTDIPLILPATALDYYCYSHMFSGCTGITRAPILPSTTLGAGCYEYMFSGCTSLTEAPELPATKLNGSCYFNMFQGCTSLTTAPELPATTLEHGCYGSMFLGCTSLTTAPELPALGGNSKYWYNRMFMNCSNLNYVKAMFTTDPTTTEFLENWLSGVSETGTFVKNSAATWTNEQVGIPSGWTVQTEV